MERGSSRRPSPSLMLDGCWGRGCWLLCAGLRSGRELTLPPLFPCSALLHGIAGRALEKRNGLLLGGLHGRMRRGSVARAEFARGTLHRRLLMSAGVCSSGELLLLGALSAGCCSVGRLLKRPREDHSLPVLAEPMVTVRDPLASSWAGCLEPVPGPGSGGSSFTAWVASRLAYRGLHLRLRCLGPSSALYFGRRHSALALPNLPPSLRSTCSLSLAR